MSTDLTTWLGPAAEDLDPEQRERLDAEYDAICERIGEDPDLVAEREAALSAAVQYLLGETDVDAAGARRAATQVAAAEASLAAQQVARMAVQDGMSEAEAARRAHLDRMTVRKVLGK